MKIKSHTPNLLVVEDAPWALGLFAILMILLCAAMAVASTALGSSLLWPMLACIAFFAACFVLLVRRNQLVMDRGSGVVAQAGRTALLFLDESARIVRYWI